MSKRHGMSRGKSRRSFSRNSGHHVKNDLRSIGPMRGGIRL